MSALYDARVTARGGRNGTIASDDGLLELTLAMPKELGGKGGATNPEQLFAGGYSACFANAILHVARGGSARLKDDDVTVVADVGLSSNGEKGFVLSVSLDVTLAGVDQATADELVRTAHAVCPYSNAVKGNIDVQITVNTR